MAVLFPTRPHPIPGRQMGSPVPADPCRCDRPIFDGAADECHRCGRLSEFTIAQTWRQQAQRLARPGRRRRKAIAA